MTLSAPGAQRPSEWPLRRRVRPGLRVSHRSPICDGRPPSSSADHGHRRAMHSPAAQLEAVCSSCEPSSAPWVPGHADQSAVKPPTGEELAACARPSAALGAGARSPRRPSRGPPAARNGDGHGPGRANAGRGKQRPFGGPDPRGRSPDRLRPDRQRVNLGSDSPPHRSLEKRERFVGGRRELNLVAHESPSSCLICSQGTGGSPDS